MKHNPHIFPFRLFVCTAAGTAALMTALGALFSLGALSSASAQEESSTSASSPRILPDVQAETVLTEVRNRLDGIPFLSCRLSETVHLSNLRFYARGHYSQANGNRVRLDFEIYPVRHVRKSDQALLALDGPEEDTGRQKPTGSLQQVSNGRTLWTLWQNGDSRRLTRRSIRQILAAADEAESFDVQQMLEDLGVGGLQALLARLQVGMEFGRVREQTVGDTRLLVLTGRWTAESLKDYFRVEKAGTALPGWVPDYVRIYVDADARLPRRIQYLKQHPNPKLSQVRPLVTLDFRSISIRSEADDSVFEFQAPDGLPELDVTEKTIEAIRKAAGATGPGEPTGSGESDSGSEASAD